MDLVFPDSITKEQFLTEYWQKKPLLLKRGLPHYQLSLGAEELAGLACEEEIESRIVLEKHGTRPWEARLGPFDEADFSTLPKSHWTLLVQDVDKHIPEVTDLLPPFHFIPGWRLDDIMISYATDQGSVGPHIDEYDVFLVQTSGTRLWKIGLTPGSTDNHIPGLDLRILPDFEPDQEWLVEPGDVLYLPPNIPHWGIAQGDGCITCSVGYRAPSYQEMALSWCEELIDQSAPARYRDRSIDPQQAYGEITRDSVDYVHHKLNQLLQASFDDKTRWLGRFCTEPKAHMQIAPLDEPLSTEEVLAGLNESGALMRNGWARMLFSRGEMQDYLFAHGEDFAVDNTHQKLLKTLTETSTLTKDILQPWLDKRDCLDLITELVNRNYLVFEDE